MFDRNDCQPNMIELRANGRAVRSFTQLVEQLGLDAVASPKRSTVPLLDYWRQPEQRLRVLERHLGVKSSVQTELHFEYEVPVQRGRGKSSYTDLMILGDDFAVAIEAKFAEPRYDSVETWLGAAHTMNRGEVLDGWIRAIEAGTEGTVDRDVVRELPYQLIHRTASVCCVSRRRRAVVYQVFGDSPGPYYTEDLRRLASAMPARGGVSFYVVANAFHPTTTYEQLAARWDAGERDISADVRDALVAGPLLEFAEPVAIPI
jgi:hypothetical protein